MAERKKNTKRVPDEARCRTCEYYRTRAGSGGMLGTCLVFAESTGANEVCEVWDAKESAAAVNVRNATAGGNRE